jgi:hypothetical protein
MHVFREILDKQVVDRDEHELGRVDGIVVEVRDGAPPRVVRLELGFVTLARRISRRLERIAESLHKRMGVRRSARYELPWEWVTDWNVHHVKVNVTADETPAYDWERWLRTHIVEKIPGASTEE